MRVVFAIISLPILACLAAFLFMLGTEFHSARTEIEVRKAHIEQVDKVRDDYDRQRARR